MLGVTVARILRTIVGYLEYSYCAEQILAQVVSKVSSQSRRYRLTEFKVMDTWCLPFVYSTAV